MSTIGNALHGIFGEIGIDLEKMATVLEKNISDVALQLLSLVSSDLAKAAEAAVAGNAPAELIVKAVEETVSQVVAASGDAPHAS